MKERERREPSEELSAYHDGELRGLARWRLERRLRRDPGLRRELELLGRVGAALRAGAEAEAPGVDLWDRIAMRLPAADAQRADALRRSRRRRRAWLVGGPLGAAAAAGLAAFAIVSGLGGDAGAADGVVRWMYAGRRNVFVVEEPGAPGTTIIWVLDDEAKDAARRRSGDMA
jgi:negative regulator of sigma E activity